MLESLFRPKSAAVIGASSKELSIGNRVIKNLIDFGFKGEIYPINPKADEIRGIKAYKSIMDCPDSIDVVHMVIPAKFVPQAMDDCGKKGVKNVIINSGGFSEIGPEGDALEKEFLATAKKYGIRVMGPNCQGIINTDLDVRSYTNFTFTMPDPGFISIVALSGGVAEVIHQAFSQMGVGTRIYASNGNACDVTIPEIIRYLGDDDGTRVIVTYVEGLRDADHFPGSCQRGGCQKTNSGNEGRPHHGRRQSGRIPHRRFGQRRHRHRFDFQKSRNPVLQRRRGVDSGSSGLSSQPIPKGNRVGIITNTGGPAVIATDVMVGAGLTLPPLSDKTREVLTETLFPEASVNNPIDVLATGPAAHYRACLDAMMADDNFDSVYVNFVTPFFVDNESIAREIVEVSNQQIKPIVCNLMTDRRQWTEVVKILQDGGVPCFALPGEAARALTAMVRYNEIRNREVGEVQAFNDVDKAAGAKIMETAKTAGKSSLSAEEVYSILEAYKIPVADWRMATNADEAEKAAADIGYPVVIKADSESIVHKSDMGGVAVDLADGAAVKAAVEKMQKSFSTGDLRFFIQKFLPGGLELIMGAKAEEGLGHAVMFGLGGIYVEIMKDVVFNLTPVSSGEAKEMLASIKGSALLEGVRGQKGVDQAKLIEIIQRLSQLLTDLPAIQEMDLNPLMAFEDQVFAVDARIAL